MWIRDKTGQLYSPNYMKKNKWIIETHTQDKVLIKIDRVSSLEGANALVSQYSDNFNNKYIYQIYYDEFGVQ